MTGSVHPSVCLSIACLSGTSSHYVSVNLSPFFLLLPLTEVISMRKINVRGQKPRSIQILPQFGIFRTATPILIATWLQNDAHSLKWCGRGAPLCSNIICQISRSHW